MLCMHGLPCSLKTGGPLEISLKYFLCDKGCTRGRYRIGEVEEERWYTGEIERGKTMETTASRGQSFSFRISFDLLLSPSFLSFTVPSRKSSRSLASLSSGQLFSFISFPARKRFRWHTADSVRVSSSIIMKNIAAVQFPGKYIRCLQRQPEMFEMPREKGKLRYGVCVYFLRDALRLVKLFRHFVTAPIKCRPCFLFCLIRE